MFVAAFDQLTPDRVRWMPYTVPDVQSRAPLGLSAMCTRDSGYWLTRRYLVYDIFVEPYSVHRVLRQLGYFQDFPIPRAPLDECHR